MGNPSPILYPTGRLTGGYQTNATDESKPRNLNRTTEAYADWLKSYQWDWFATVTFRYPRRDTLAALSAVWKAARPMASRAFLAAEPHQTGDVHVHGLLRVPGSDQTGWRTNQPNGVPLLPAVPSGMWHEMFHRFGRTRVEWCRSREQVSGYCAKYVLKSEGKWRFEYGVFGNTEEWLKLED